MITENFDDDEMHESNMKADLAKLERAFQDAGYQTFFDPKSFSFNLEHTTGTFRVTASRGPNPRGQPEVFIQYYYKATAKNRTIPVRIAKSLQVSIYSDRNRETQIAQTEQSRKVILPLIENIVGSQSKIMVQYRYPNPGIEVEFVNEDISQEDGDDGVPENPGPFEL